MDEQKKIEQLLTEIMNHFADTFDRRAIVRGGMVLRLLDSPRLTNDLDYLFVPYGSKNDIKKMVVEALESLEGVQVTANLNSKCLRCKVQRGETVVQVEAKVDKSCKVKVLSTASLSKLYNLTPRIVQVMSFEVALANKLAAWYERRLVRDLYDVYLYLSMGVLPDPTVLARRLKKPEFSRRVTSSTVPLDSHQFYSFLKKEVEQLSEKQITAELQAILPQEEMLGLDVKIRKAVNATLLVRGRLGYMLDTMIFNRMADGNIEDLTIDSLDAVYVTPIQGVELRNTKVSTRRHNLIRQEILTSATVINDALYGSPEQYPSKEEIKATLEAKKRARGNANDAEIIWLSLVNRLVFVSENKNACAVAQEFGCGVMSLKTFLLDAA